MSAESDADAERLRVMLGADRVRWDDDDLVIEKGGLRARIAAGCGFYMGDCRGASVYVRSVDPLSVEGP